MARRTERLRALDTALINSEDKLAAKDGMKLAQNAAGIIIEGKPGIRQKVVRMKKISPSGYES
ncbi:MAG: hypothetical protein F6K21_12725 [Symploca sp. SIO2D2]|nr:hypothetical protein [Symploca sp. SIO2D2]